MSIYKRVLLKLSGESLMGAQKYGLSTEVLNQYAEQIRTVAATGVQVGIVIGGGNIFRGLSGVSRGFDRVKGDQMGCWRPLSTRWRYRARSKAPEREPGY